MAEICCGLVSDGQASTPGESSSRAARRRRMEIRRFKFVAGVGPPADAKERGQKRPKGKSRDCENAVENCCSEENKHTVKAEFGRSATDLTSVSSVTVSLLRSPSAPADPDDFIEIPKFGFASVCGRRRDMEDALAIVPSFHRCYKETAAELHYFGVYDGHGCSHVRFFSFPFLN